MTAAEGRRSRLGPTLLKAALLLSLCLNVALGTYLGVQWRDGRHGVLTAAGAARVIDRMADRLPEADGERLREIFASKRIELSEAQTRYDAAMRHSLDLLAAPDLDVAAFRDAVREARDQRLAVGDVLIGTIVETLTEMPAKERQELAGRLRRRQ